MSLFADFAIIPASAYDEIMRLDAAGDPDGAADLIIDLLDADVVLDDANPDPFAAAPATFSGQDTGTGTGTGNPPLSGALPRVRLGAYWRGVMVLLTGHDDGGNRPDDPLREALMGEHQFFADAHYGVVSPERVPEVLAALRAVDVDGAIDEGAGGRAPRALRGLLGLRRVRIHGQPCEYPADYVRAGYRTLVDIYDDAARRGAAVAVALG